MKTIFHNGITAVAFVAVLGGLAIAETVHQSSPAGKFRTGDGANAVEKGTMEVKREVEGATDGQVSRVKGDMNQWGFVTCWFGLPAPAGKSTVRFHLYPDGQPTAKYLLYVRGKEGQAQVGELKVPADAKPNEFVDVDVAVDAKEEWSGLVIKKADTSDLPSPWIDTVSVVLP